MKKNRWGKQGSVGQAPAKNFVLLFSIFGCYLELFLLDTRLIK